ncbi:MAG: hypothetical protein ACTMH8_12635, partial [Brevibacterium aurantiacum]
MSSEPEDLHAPQYQRGLRHQRSLRGIAAAVFATFVALASHMIGGGALPSAMGVVVPLVLSMLVCVLLAGRRLSLLRLSLSVLVSQSLFHLLFSVFTPMTGSHSPANALERHAMHHSGPETMPGSVFASDAGASMHTHASPGMLLAHLIAAVLTIAMIYWSEALPAKIGSFLRLVIHALLPTAVRPMPVPNGPKPH